MNLFLVGTIIFVLVYLLLNWFVKTSSKAIAQGTRKIILFFSIVLAILLAYGGKFLLSLPVTLIVLSALKIKGLSTIQIFQLWRLIQYLRNEAHRFCLKHHKRKRNKLFLKSELNNINGIGKQTIIKLFKYFKSLYKIKKTSKENLIKIIGIKKSIIIYEHFNK